MTNSVPAADAADTPRFDLEPNFPWNRDLAKLRLPLAMSGIARMLADPDEAIERIERAVRAERVTLDKRTGFKVSNPGPKSQFEDEWASIEAEFGSSIMQRVRVGEIWSALHYDQDPEGATCWHFEIVGKMRIKGAGVLVANMVPPGGPRYAEPWSNVVTFTDNGFELSCDTIRLAGFVLFQKTRRKSIVSVR